MIATHGKIQCIKCGESHPFSDYALQALEEDAILICPSCGAEFTIAATLAEMPPDEEEPPPEEEPEELPPGEEPGAEELGPEGEEEELGVESKGRPGKEKLRVLVCSSCHREWLSIQNVSCPFCESKDVMVSTKTPQKKAEELVDDVRRGILPASRAVAILVGRVQR